LSYTQPTCQLGLREPQLGLSDFAEVEHDGEYMRMRISGSTALFESELVRKARPSYALGMSGDLARKIQNIRRQLGLTQAEFADKLNVSQGSVSRWEKGSKPEYDMTVRIAEVAGMDIRLLLSGDSGPDVSQPPRLMVRGAVAAGVWREAVQWEEADWFPYMGGEHVSAPLDRRFGLRVEGDSMNLVYPQGTILDCVSTIGSSETIRSGQRVIVVRTRVDGTHESTVKEYHVDQSGREWLLPRSSNPAFQAPVEIGSRADGIVETAIIAVVKGSYIPE